MTNSSELTILDLKKSETGQVKEVSGNDSVSRRLEDMGIVPGSNISLERKSPLGGAVILSLRGYQLAIRKAEAKRIVLAKISS
jgi:ferrous iron transport protein A